MDDAKAPANNARAAKQMVHLLRRAALVATSKSLQVLAQQQVTHGAAHHKSGKAGLLQAGGDFQRGRTDARGAPLCWVNGNTLGLGRRSGSLNTRLRSLRIIAFRSTVAKTRR